MALQEEAGAVLLLGLKQLAQEDADHKLLMSFVVASIAVRNPNSVAWCYARSSRTRNGIRRVCNGQVTVPLGLEVAFKQLSLPRDSCV